MAKLTAKEEAAKKTKQIASEWQTFSKTAAYKEFREYIELQDYCAIMAAKGPVMPFNEEGDSEFVFDKEKAASLLQRSVGYDIVVSYVDGYVNNLTLSA